jgi:hypothetical protein
VTRLLAYGSLLLLLAACTEQSTSPGVCPDFCPGGTIEIKDTVFAAIIQRDSAFGGYLQPYQAEAMTVTDLPGVIDSRAFFTTDTMRGRVAPKTGDTTTVPIFVDSARVRFVLVRRPKNTTNLRLRLYQLPVTADSTSDFASLDAYFTATPLDSLNVSDLLALPAIGDTQTVRLWGDSIRVDTAGHVLQINRLDSTVAIYFHLDSLQAVLSDTDTGRVAFGVRVAADSFASVTLGTTESGGNSPLLRRFYHYTIPDTVSATPDSVVHKDKTVSNRFDSFVFSPPNPALDSNLTVGGAPSARALLRVALPAFLHDSIDIVRATVILMPVNAVPGAPSDSFQVIARPVVTDLGAKSPLGTTPALFGRTFVHPGVTDTVRLELTNLVRAWSLDTSMVTTFILGQVPEATSFTEAHFYSSRAPAYRPALHVTYVKRFAFGEP